VAPLLLFTILAMLMLQLQSFSLMTMVFLTAPLGLIGVVGGLLLFQAPLGFVAHSRRHRTVRNDHAQLGDPGRPDPHRDEAGLDPWNAVLEAAVKRTPPVVLTAAATGLAMIPLTHSVFWSPMAIAIMDGLASATVLTIFFVPALYAAWFKLGRQPAGGTDPVPGSAVLDS
jgi:multidrug efflux pump